jgi:quinol-cytochrome oxidoreductase complex cytochrome b subunit
VRTERKPAEPVPNDHSLEGDLPGRKPMPFFPDFALIESLAALVLLVALILVASLTRPSLEEIADPTSSGYVPRPEWYFLWLFQTLKYFKGKSEVIGTFVLPTVAIGLLIALPFIDRRERPRPLLPHTRPVRLWPRLVAAGALITIGSLTLLAAQSAIPMGSAVEPLTGAEAAGRVLFDKMGCASCHTIAGVGGTRGPDLTAFGSRPDARERVLLHFSGVATSGSSLMPGYELSPDELEALSTYLLSLKAGEP